MKSVLILLLVLCATTSAQDVAFFAKKSYTSRPGVIYFRDTDTNYGDGWDRQTSVFKTYHPGLYFFTYSALSEENDYCRLGLTKNSYEVMVTYGHHNYQQVTGSAVLYLNRNDELRLELMEGRIYESPNHDRAYTTLLGYKINGGNMAIQTDPGDVRPRPGEIQN